MTDIIDLTVEREKRDGPDEDCIYIDRYDGKGTRWFKFSASYADDSKEFSIDFWATDMEDAQRRIDLMRANMTLVGQVFGRIFP